MEVSRTTLSPEDKAAWVQSMFDRIAPRYDLFNDVLSLGIHRQWRGQTIAALDPHDGARYLDLCAGTLDLACAMADRSPGARVIGVDFVFKMLEIGQNKAALAGGTVWPCAANALRLPFRDGVFAGLTIGFGLRNLADHRAGLTEMKRVLEPGGKLVILEFTTPPGRLFRTLYHGYFHHVLPRLGGFIAGDRSASRYLPESVSVFPDALSLAALVREVGFTQVRHKLLTGGIAALHWGVKE